MLRKFFKIVCNGILMAAISCALGVGLAFAYFVYWCLEIWNVPPNIALFITGIVCSVIAVGAAGADMMENRLEQYKASVLNDINQSMKAQREAIETQRITLDQKIKSQAKWNEVFLTAAEEKVQTYPWLAVVLADTQKNCDEEISRFLRTKSRPAVSAAKEVSKIAKEKRELLKQCKMYEYQLAYYESLFPWLEEFKKLDPKQGASYVHGLSEEPESEYESLRLWLSPEEYQALPTAEKYQLALDRYKKRNKSDWEIGIEFERYIGYLYENNGFKVKYHGALMGLRDMGRDLIATKGTNRCVIQCKRWGQGKTIHEKHIFQLYGSTVLMNVKGKQPYKGVFVTTTALSDVAKDCADYLKIEVREKIKIEDYPMIKCNVSADGEKIYHLPFDQQYDRVNIAGKDGACYVSTVAEAEQLGFRRAYRWRPNKANQK